MACGGIMAGQRRGRTDLPSSAGSRNSTVSLISARVLLVVGSNSPRAVTVLLLTRVRIVAIKRIGRAAGGEGEGEEQAG